MVVLRAFQGEQRARRGMFLLPSMLTVANLFCGYACLVYTLRGEFSTAAPFIGIALVLDSLDGRIARLMNATSAFGVEFDSLADIVSFGVAPAILVCAWGLTPFGQLGWAAGFLYVVAAGTRLARFNIQRGTVDKRYFVGMPSPSAACVLAATVFAFPTPSVSAIEALPIFLVVLIPAFLRDFKIPTGSISSGSYFPVAYFCIISLLLVSKGSINSSRPKSANIFMNSLSTS